MVSSGYCQTLARYNAWMNARLYDVCATLADDALHADRGAFFGSIYATLNHIAYADLAFLSRFTGDPAVVPELDADLFGSFAALRQERDAIDARLLSWTETLTPEWLDQPLTYVSKVDGVTRTRQRWLL